MAEIVGKSSNNNYLKNDSLQQEKNEELDISNEDIEIEELDEYSNSIKQQILSESFITYTDSFDGCSYELIQYIKVSSKITEKLPIYISDNRILISCFLASLLFKNKTANYFKNHGISFIECMKKQGKDESNILERQTTDKNYIKTMGDIREYLENQFGFTINKTTTISSIVYTILDSNKAKSYCIENLIYSVNPSIEIRSSLLSTIREYNENYQKELYAKKYNEVFGNVSENTFECIKYAYEIYCESLTLPIEKIARIGQDLDKLSLIIAFAKKANIDEMLKKFFQEIYETLEYIKVTTIKRLRIKDLNEISSIYSKYIKDENGINLEVSDILNNLMCEYNMDREYEEYKTKIEENLKKKTQETLDKISKYEFSDYIITSYKIYKHLKTKLSPEKDNETNIFAYSLFLGIYCTNNLIRWYLVSNHILYENVIKTFELNSDKIKDLEVRNFDNEEIEPDISDFWNKVDNDIFIVCRTFTIIRCDKEIKSVEDFFLKAENILKPITDNFNLSWQELKKYLNLRRFADIPVSWTNFNNTICLANYGNNLLPLVEEINRVSQESIKIDINVGQLNTMLRTLEYNKRKNFFRRLIREKVSTVTKETIDNMSKTLNEQLTIFEEEVNVCTYLKKLIAIYIEKIEKHIKILKEELKTCEKLSKKDKKSAKGMMMADDAESKKQQLQSKIKDFKDGITGMLGMYKQISCADKLAGIYMNRINFGINIIIPSLYNNISIKKILEKQQEVSMAIDFLGDMFYSMVSLNNEGIIRSLETIKNDESFSKLVPTIPEQLLLEIKDNRSEEKLSGKPYTKK